MDLDLDLDLDHTDAQPCGPSFLYCTETAWSLNCIEQLTTEYGSGHAIRLNRAIFSFPILGL